ncbi:MAG: DUF1802 family protein [Chloroflexi bacterium]|nr:DUF1802 family protein [Chloroflexota bacterium]
MLLPPAETMALKEWAVAVKALSEGRQIVILRKGGIHKEDRDFRIVHPEFLLYPTYEHQKAALIKPEYHADLQQTLDENDVPGLLSIGFWCQVTDKFELRDEDMLESISAHHIWSAEYAQKRLHWRPKQPLTVALLRVYAMQQPQAIPVLDEYIGCKSWVDLGQEVPLGVLRAALSDADYQQKANPIRRALEGAAAPV